jgi:hypothetical protein
VEHSIAQKIQALSIAAGKANRYCAQARERAQ